MLIGMLKLAEDRKGFKKVPETVLVTVRYVIARNTSSFCSISPRFNVQFTTGKYWKGTIISKIIKTVSLYLPASLFLVVAA